MQQSSSMQFLIELCKKTLINAARRNNKIILSQFGPQHNFIHLSRLMRQPTFACHDCEQVFSDIFAFLEHSYEKQVFDSNEAWQIKYSEDKFCKLCLTYKKTKIELIYHIVKHIEDAYNLKIPFNNEKEINNTTAKSNNNNENISEEIYTTGNNTTENLNVVQQRSEYYNKDQYKHQNNQHISKNDHHKHQNGQHRSQNGNTLRQDQYTHRKEHGQQNNQYRLENGEYAHQKDQYAHRKDQYTHRKHRYGQQNDQYISQNSQIRQRNIQYRPQNYQLHASKLIIDQQNNANNTSQFSIEKTLTPSHQHQTMIPHFRVVLNDQGTTPNYIPIPVIDLEASIEESISTRTRMPPLESISPVPLVIDETDWSQNKKERDVDGPLSVGVTHEPDTKAKSNDMFEVETIKERGVSQPHQNQVSVRRKQDYYKAMQKTKDYQCKFCHRSFHRFTDVRKHMHKYDTKCVVSISCDTCARVYKSRKLCDKHAEKCEVAHLNEPKQFHCKCGKSFSRSNYLAVHLKYGHEDNIQCLICDRWYKNMMSLKEHKRLIHHLY